MSEGSCLRLTQWSYDIKVIISFFSFFSTILSIPSCPLIVTSWSHVVWLLLPQYWILIPGMVEKRNREAKGVVCFSENPVLHWTLSLHLHDRNKATGSCLHSRDAGELVFLTSHVLGWTKVGIINENEEENRHWIYNQQSLL